MCENKKRVEFNSLSNCTPPFRQFQITAIIFEKKRVSIIILKSSNNNTKKPYFNCVILSELYL